MPSLLKKMLSRGAAEESQYAMHMTVANPDALEEYKGNCHCGAVKYTILYAPLASQRVILCNCSLCTAHGLIMIHPMRKAVTFTKGENTQGLYVTLNKRMRFCRTCAVTTIFDVEDPVNQGDETIGVNVRTIQGLNLDKLMYHYHDGAAQSPQYEVPD